MNDLELTPAQVEQAHKAIAEADSHVTEAVAVLRHLRQETSRVQATAISAVVLSESFGRDALVSLLQATLERLADTEAQDEPAALPVAPEWGNGGYL